MLAATERTREPGFALTVLYGEATINTDDASRFTEVVTKAGGTAKKVQQLHAKVLLSDDLLCVSSYNFLSADPYGTAKESREIGIKIIGSEPATWVADRLSTV